jgi:uncharacterized membrane protein YhaH (DUF805 family)
MFEYMIMPFQRYAEFSGRSRRLEYWAFVLMNAVIFIVLGGIAVAMGFSFSALSGGDFGGAAFSAGMMAPFAVMGIYTLLVIIPSIAVTVRRLHDRNMSGWWYLGFIVLSALPIVGFVSNVAFLVIMFLPGTAGPNRFGEDPKGPTGSQIFA